MVISRDVIFDEKIMLHNTQKEDKQAPENHYSDEHVVQVELETHNAKDDTQNVEIASTKDQKPYSIATSKIIALSSHLPCMVLRIWFLMH